MNSSALRIGEGLSTDIDAVRAAGEASTEATRYLDADPDLVAVFIAADHRDAAEEISMLLGERYPRAALIGCVSQGIIGGPRELEAGPAVSVWASRLPDTTIVPFEMAFDDGEGAYTGWPEDLPGDAALLLLVDPWSFPPEHFVQTVNEERPGLRVIGGVASGLHAAGEARLLLGDDVRSAGAVGAAIWGRVRVDGLVSQGCRPIGAPATVTRADRHIVFEVAGERPVDLIRKMWINASPHERALMQDGLFIGRVVDEYKSDFGRGDFLIRSVVGADPVNGVMAVSGLVNVGETVQFHVRDPATADEDLREMLAAVPVHPAGALLFTCNGRGSNMFDDLDHDATAVSKGFGGTPLAGFFANGEIGPVGGRNFLHSFTASLALFVDTQAV